MKRPSPGADNDVGTPTSARFAESAEDVGFPRLIAGLLALGLQGNMHKNNSKDLQF